MTEGEGPRRPGGARDNQRDELDEAAGVSKRDAQREAVEEEEEAGGGGGAGVKDNVTDDLDEAQER